MSKMKQVIKTLSVLAASIMIASCSGDSKEAPPRSTLHRGSYGFERYTFTGLLISDLTPECIY